MMNRKLLQTISCGIRSTRRTIETRTSRGTHVDDSALVGYSDLASIRRRPRDRPKKITRPWQSAISCAAAGKRGGIRGEWEN